MNTQELLNRMNDIVKLVDDQGVGVTLTNSIHSLRDDIAAQLRHEIAQNQGRGNAAKTIERMLKPMRDGRVSLAYPWYDAEQRQCVCDGYRAYRLKRPLPLPERPENAGKPIDLDKIFPHSTSDYASITLPDYNAVKSFIAEDHAQNGNKSTASWKFGFRQPTVNAQYLLDLMTVFPRATEIMYIPTAAGMMKPMWMQCEDGDAILLPIRVMQNNDFTPEEHDRSVAEMRIRSRYDSMRKYIDANHAPYEIEFDDFADLTDTLSRLA